MNEWCQGLNDKPIKVMEGCPSINCQGDKLHTGGRDMNMLLEDAVKLRGVLKLSIRSTVYATH